MKDIVPVASVNVIQSPNILHFIIKFITVKIACNKITTFSHHDTMFDNTM